MQQQFSAGDRVRHAERPEWGVGVIEQSQVIPYAGGRAQRLTVRFDHHGRVTLNTAHARLIAGAAVGAPGTGGSGWLASLESDGPADRLRSLPDATADALSTPEHRLRATLDLYRFNDEPRSLLDWAIAQTGLHDPLSQYNRHELEEAFKAYAQLRETRLIENARELRRLGRADLLDPNKQSDPNHRRALARIARAVR